MTIQQYDNIDIYSKKIATYTSGVNHANQFDSEWVRHHFTNIEPRMLCQSKINSKYTENVNNVYEFITLYQKNIPTHILDSNDVKIIHSLFTTNTDLELSGGQYRETDNKRLRIIVNGDFMCPPPHTRIAYDMNNILFWANTSPDNIFNRAFNLHYNIIELQPFNDCNKRVARAAMNLFLGLNKKPMIFFDKPEDKTEYIRAFAARANGNIKEYTEYMLYVTERSYCNMLKNIKHPKIL